MSDGYRFQFGYGHIHLSRIERNDEAPSFRHIFKNPRCFYTLAHRICEAELKPKLKDYVVGPSPNRMISHTNRD